jgi:cobalt-zinc-cadmium efflux system membrane fusion protein
VLVEAASTELAAELVKKNVVVGRRGGGAAEIIGGDLYPGDRVVTTGAQELATFFVQGVLRPSPEAARNMGLRVEQAALHPVDEIVEVDGAVDLPPERRATVAAQLSGYLQKIVVDRGQQVRRGEVLAEVASVPFQETQLDLLRAELEAALLAETLARFEKLDRQTAIAQSERQAAEAGYRGAILRRDAARRTLLAVGLSAEQLDALVADRRMVERMPVRAPIDGVVVGMDKTLGQILEAEQPLFEIHDLSTVWVRAFLSQRDVARAGIGTAARIRLLTAPGYLGEGVVVRSSGMLGLSDRTLAAWVETTQPAENSAYHNGLARCTFVAGRSEPVLAVPWTAVVSQGTQSYVFVQDEQGRFQRRPVELGRRDDLRVEIASGLVPGELVAMQGAAQLQTAYASIR